MCVCVCVCMYRCVCMHVYEYVWEITHACLYIDIEDYH